MIGTLQPKKGDETVIKVAQINMQFSDTHQQMEVDAARIVNKAVHEDYRWVTGGEAGATSDLSNILEGAFLKRGYHFFRPRGQDSWVAIDKKVTKGLAEVEYEKVVDGVAKQYTNKGPLSVTYEDRLLGETTIITCHLLTKGRPVANAEQSQRLDKNQRLMDAIGRIGREKGAGRALVFFQGDTNIDDRISDVFLGNPFTTLADELKAWKGTGHGPIDVIASYNRDGRVRGKSWKVLDDNKVALATDHFLCEGEFYVRLPGLR